MSKKGNVKFKEIEEELKKIEEETPNHKEDNLDIKERKARKEVEKAVSGLSLII